MGVHYCTPAVLGKGAVNDSRAAPTKTASTVEDLQLLGLSISHQPELVVLVVFVFPWGLEHPGVFSSGGLLTQGCFQVA
jgi:hypothetical protein